jgi:GTP cyclohydrolase I
MKPEQIPEAEDLVRRFIELIGDDPERDGLKETPARVAKAWVTLFGGYHEDPNSHAKVFEEQYDDIVVIRNIRYYSWCEHHILPFIGDAQVAYLPNGAGKVLGASKLCRIVNVFARRLQIQEKLTRQVAEAVQEMINPMGVAVILDGEHMCMQARGVEQRHASMRTSSMLGVFRDDSTARAEVMQLLFNRVR